MAEEPASTPDEQAEPVRSGRGLDIRTLSLAGLLVLAAFYTLYFVRSLLLPVILALLLSYLIVPLVRRLATLGIPMKVGAALVLLMFGAAAALLAAQLAPTAAEWIEKAPYSISKVEEKLAAIKRPVQKVTAATEKIEALTTGGESAAPAPVVQVKRTGIGELLVNQTPEFFAQTVMMIILLYFLLAFDGAFLGKVVRVSTRFENKKNAVTIGREIEHCISRYLVTVTLINCALGVVIAFAMHFLGMPNPVLWGVMATVLNFIPYLGAAVGVAVIAVAALLSFDSLGWALVYPATYIVITSVEGNFITPMIVGRSLTLNPLAIVLGLMFWGWLWGIIGALLAVPILASIKIVCERIQPLEPVAEFLSD